MKQKGPRAVLSKACIVTKADQFPKDFITSGLVYKINAEGRSIRPAVPEITFYKHVMS